MFQDFQLLGDRSIFENLRFVMKATGWREEEQIKKQINEVLEKVGLFGKGAKTVNNCFLYLFMSQN